jgi:hypothetical protein
VSRLERSRPLCDQMRHDPGAAARTLAAPAVPAFAGACATIIRKDGPW